jgi:hypothetical protein
MQARLLRRQLGRGMACVTAVLDDGGGMPEPQNLPIGRRQCLAFLPKFAAASHARQPHRAV